MSTGSWPFKIVWPCTMCTSEFHKRAVLRTHLIDSHGVSKGHAEVTVMQIVSQKRRKDQWGKTSTLAKNSSGGR